MAHAAEHRQVWSILWRVRQIYESLLPILRHWATFVGYAVKSRRTSNEESFGGLENGWGEVSANHLLTSTDGMVYYID